jgi:hypothetical protein
MSTIPPSCVQEKACVSPLPVELDPTTCPFAFTAVALLELPPSVPMSTIPVARLHENACASPIRVKLSPTT